MSIDCLNPIVRPGPTVAELILTVGLQESDLSDRSPTVAEFIPMVQVRQTDLTDRRTTVAELCPTVGFATI